MELGVYSFGELTAARGDGRTIGPEQRLRDLLEEIELADQVGLDVFGVGEHHRPDFSVSAPAVVLAAAAARTKAIRLTSAVSVISSDDPVMRSIELFGTAVAPAVRAEVERGPPRPPSHSRTGNLDASAGVCTAEARGEER